MARLIQGRYNRYAHASDMYRLLGVRPGHLPNEGIPERVIEGVRVYVRPLVTECLCPQIWNGHDEPQPDPTRVERDCPVHGANKGRRNWQGLRVMAICECGRHIPVGRLHQHKCKGGR
jgi:hypothetical protein